MRKLIIAVAMLGLGACSNHGGLLGTHDGDEIAALGGAKDEFHSALHKQYADLGHAEYGEFDWCDGDVFLDKAWEAGSGYDVSHVPVSDRHLASKYTADASSYASRLAAAFANGAREAKPETAAKAQTSFDCWLQEAEEDIQPDHIAACRDALEAALAELEGKPAPAPMAPETMGANPTKFVVWFAFDSAEITDIAANIIDRAAAAAKEQGTKLVVVVGHTDKAGPEWYNETLSLLRAEAVKGELIKREIAAENITARGAGEVEPAVDTADGVRNAANRRAEIWLR